MDFNPYATEDKQQKVRIIIATAAIAVIVLGIATWAIIAIVGGKDNKVSTEQNATVAVDDNANNTSANSNKDQSASSEVAPESDGVSNSGNVTEVHSTGDDAPTTSLPTPVVITQEASVPTTGPEEILPFALVAGMLVAYLYSRKLATREA
ncbi:hypothetical protein IJG79_03295 [Candidatus Saccharibacteria bacterium]|nr:hypothetical protein [Candidatus Saccharibacteria bacterium]